MSGSLAPLSEEEAQAQSAGGSDTTFLWAEQFGTSVGLPYRLDLGRVEPEAGEARDD